MNSNTSNITAYKMKLGQKDQKFGGEIKLMKCVDRSG